MNICGNTVPPVITVDAKLCVNCHACIAVCPVKFCNDGSDGYVKIKAETCIGCGRCLAACTHDARKALDDLDSFLLALDRGLPMIALVAPSVAVSFPDQWLQLNGWLRSVGISAVFDVSFGAELTVQSYADYIRAENPSCLIASPCPVVVSYVSIYRPELIPYLAPYDSPMLHTLKMISSVYPEYRNHRSVIISPCLAKKREFVQGGMGDFNLTMASLKGHLQSHGIDLSSFSPTEFDQQPARKGVLFSSPGGLLRNMEQHFPGITGRSRKIEGRELFEYLDQLPAVIARGHAPLVVDCLSCERGCNGGPGSAAASVSWDEQEHAVARRAVDLNPFDLDQHRNDLRPFMDGISYHRTIQDQAALNHMVEPSEDEIARIYRLMFKDGPGDVLNCRACGYSSCRDMAKAIFNGLNRPENCHKYLQKSMGIEHEKSLRSYHMFWDMFQFAPDAGFIADSGCIADCNPAACQLFGLKREQIVGVSLESFFGCQPSSRPCLSATLSANKLLLEKGGVVKCDCVLRLRDGGVFDANIRASRLRIDDCCSLQIHVKDVTLMNRSRRVLEDGHAYVKALFESVGVGILVIDCETRTIIDVNSYALLLMNVSRDEVVGQRCHCFVCPAEVGNCPVIDAGEEVETSERILLDRDGRRVPILKTAIRARLGGRDCLIESFVDLSMKKETELALKNACADAERANRAKSEFLANMSHEIRTPISGVMGMADLLLDMNQPDDQRELVQDILFSANNLLSVINDILDISRIEARGLVLENISFRVAEAVSQTVRVLGPLAEKRGNKLLVRYDSVVPDCLIGDPTRFRQVLLNLLGNAIKFTENGQIELILSGKKSVDNSFYRLTVNIRDNGIGIAPDKQALIFDKFSQADSSTTREYGGTGLGLAITRELVGLMGGAICVSSELGRGTDFSFFIELSEAAVGSGNERCSLARAELSEDFGHVSVLLVEDNRVNRVVISKALERYGCTVTMAENGQLAIDRLREHTYDIVFMDCSMPVMDGYEATRRIRQRLKMTTLPVIAITAHAMQGDDRRCYDAGMNGYVKKPINRDHLLQTLNKFCGVARA